MNDKLTPLKLTKLKIDGNNYTIEEDDKTPFTSIRFFPKEQIIDCLNFAFNMTFGKKGEHNPKLASGGDYIRPQLEIFEKAFHGKLAEFGFYNEYKSLYPKRYISPPNLETWEIGKWDFTDFTIKDGDKTYNVAVKSSTQKANLLLLETKDWDHNGIYKYGKVKYSVIVFVRIESKLKYENLIKFEDDTYKFDEYFFEKINSGNLYFIYYDIPGFITRKDLIDVIKEKQIIKRFSTLNKKTIIIAENYYVVAKDLRSIVKD